MSVVTDTWRQLVRRRLWPVALLLVAALVAVPFAARQGPRAASAAPAAPAAKRRRRPSAADADPIVAPGHRRGGAAAGACSARARTRSSPRPLRRPSRRRPSTRRRHGDRRRPVDGRRDRLRRLDAAAHGARLDRPGQPDPGGARGAEADLPAVHADRPLRRLDVGRARAQQGQAPRGAARRRTSPCSSTSACKEGGKAAVFMVDDGVSAQGDGICKPDARPPARRSHLREGDTEFFDVLDEDGNVDRPVPARPLDIKTKHTASAAAAAQGLRQADSKAGRKVLRARRPPRPAALPLRRPQAARVQQARQARPSRPPWRSDALAPRLGNLRAGRRRAFEPAAGRGPRSRRLIGSPRVTLRVITAGESHGPGLTCIVEGLPGRPRARPRGDRPRHGPPPARPRPRRADEDRARRRRGHLRRPPRPHARRPDRPLGRQPRLRQLGGADEPLAGRGRRAGGAPPAPGPRRPGRACRSSASPTCATCSSAPARARRPPAWPAARWPRRSCARSASRSSRT